MRIFVFSDTHGDISGMDLVLSKTEPEVIIHCGDGVADAKEIQMKYPKIEFHIVRGNYGDDNYSIEQEKYIQIMGYSIYITHGNKFDNLGIHGEGVTKSSHASEIVKYAKEHGANIVLHGHTHLATFSFDNGIYLLNPGSASLKKPYDYKPTFGCIEIYENNIIFKLLSVEVFENLSSSK
jgi:putative phosphoesterase